MVILGLGSNLGERYDYLGHALWKISYLLEDMRVSRVLESKALLPKEAQAQADMDLPYLNMAVSGKTKLTPSLLLEELKTIEQELGRVYRCLWGPREIDIDILAFDAVVCAEEKLSIPHPELLNRDFALIPLGDVAPDWRYPVAGEFFGKLPAEIIAAKGYRIGPDLQETGLRFDG